MADRRPQLRSSPRSHGGSELQSYAAGKRQKPQETRLRLNKRGINRSAALWALCRCRHNAHATKARHRLNRDYGLSRFGNTAYAREEIVAELTSVFLGQTLGFIAHTLEMNAAYLYNWLRVLRSDKNAIFKHAADAQRACDYLIARSEAGSAGEGAQAA